MASCLLFVLFLYAQVRSARAETYGETVISMTSYPSAGLKPSGTW